MRQRLGTRSRHGVRLETVVAEGNAGTKVFACSFACRQDLTSCDSILDTQC